MFKRITALILAFASLSLFTALAETPFELKIERTQNGEKIVQRMIVSGTADKALADKGVSVAVLRPGMTLESSADIFEKYAAFHQTFVRLNGSWYLDFSFNDAEGLYTVLVRVNDGKILENQIFCYSLDALVELMDKAKKGELSEEELASSLNEDYSALGIDGEIFAELSGESQNFAAKKIIENMEEFTVDELSSLLSEYSLLSALVFENAFGIREKAIGKYKDAGEGVLTQHFEKYLTLDEQSRKEILEAAEKSEAEELKDIEAALKDKIFICSFRKLDNYTQIGTLISELGEYFSDETLSARLSELGNTKKNIVLSYIWDNKGKAESIEDFEKLLSYGLDNLNALIEKNNKPSGGGGGGGGGGSVKKPTEVKVTPPEEKEEEKEVVSETVENPSFSDIGEFGWAVTSINKLHEENIINGREKGIFAPADNVTRAEFAKMTASVLGLPLSDESFFDDVNENHWSFGYINALHKKGIIQGISEKSFLPDEYITRQDIAVIIYRVLVTSGYSFGVESYTADYSDAGEIADYAKAAIGMLSETELMNGYEDNTVRPLKNASRAETAVLLAKLYGILK